MLKSSLLLFSLLATFAPTLGAQTSVKTQSAPVKLRAKIEVSSAAIQRGRAFVDGPAFIPSAWLSVPYGFAFGVWGAMPLADREGQDPVFYKQEQGQFSKVDLYGYYKAPSLSFLEAEFILAQYQFPGENRLPEPLMNDAIARLSVPVPLHPYVFVSYGLSSVIERDIYVEGGIQELLFQQQSHSIQGQALTTWRKPDQPTPTKQEGQGHSQLTLAYNYNTLQLAANYLAQGKKDVLDVKTATAFNMALSHTQVF